MFDLNALTFINPLILWALLVLPLVYFLIRFFPPAPQRLAFPAFRLINKLQDKQTTPQTSPIWLLLLRLSMLSLLIIGLAHPIIHQHNSQLNGKPLHLIIQNDWAAGQNWPTMKNFAKSLIQQATQQNIRYEIAVTNPYESLGETITDIDAIEPQPWLAEMPEVTANDTEIIILGSGGSLNIKDKIATLYVPAITPPSLVKTEDGFVVKTPHSDNHTIEILNNTGLATSTITAKPNTPFTLTDEYGPQRLHIKNQNHAGATYLLPTEQQKIRVGIASIEAEESSPISAAFYIETALQAQQPTLGYLSDLLKENYSAIILPDQSLDNATIDQLRKWITNGGMLVRFAGKSMLENPYDDLSPVVLRKSFRTTDGALSATQSPRIDSINTDSPIASLAPPQEDIRITQQVLADPRFDITDKTWVLLEDNTPLVTAKRSGKGHIILIHTTADAVNSDFSFSGFFPRLLNRIVNLAPYIQQDNIETQPTQRYMLLRALDGFGQLQNTQTSTNGFDTLNTASEETPPGYYEHAGGVVPFNLLPKNIEQTKKQEIYPEQQQHDLRAFFLTLALLLLLIDACLPFMHKFGIFCLTGIVLISLTKTAYAQDHPEARQLSFAYVETGDMRFDQETENGLALLKELIATRSSVVADTVKGIDINNDNLAFYPMLYWRIREGQATPTSAVVKQKLQNYLSHGGTIFFDITDSNYRYNGQSPTLQKITAGLNIPALEEIPDDHTLRRSFYLLPDLSRIGVGKLWTETQPLAGRDNVSSVMISTFDFAPKWAAQSDRTSFRRQDMAWRFGMNLYMYILTGNYKTDQVHIPFILERLEE